MINEQLLRPVINHGILSPKSASELISTWGMKSITELADATSRENDISIAHTLVAMSLPS